MNVMKKYIAILFLFVAFSCQKKETLDATFRMEVKGYIEEECYTLGEAQNLYLWSSKSWPDRQVSALEYRVDPTLLESYNAEEGLNLKLLPDSCYLMEQTHFEMSDDDEFAKFKVKYWPEKIIHAGGSFNKVEYALPLRLWVNGVPQDERYASVVVGFLINPAEFSLANAENVTAFTLDVSQVYEFSVVFGTNYNNKEWINAEFELAPDLVQEYNNEHGTEYLPLPNADKVVSWLADEIVLDRDENQDSVTFFADMVQSGIDKSDKSRYMLPIRLVGISSEKCKVINNVRYFTWWNSKMEQSLWRVTTRSTASGSPSNLNDDDLASGWLWDYSRKNEIATDPENITYMLKDVTKLAVVHKVECHPWKGVNTAWMGAKDIAVQVTMDGEEWTTVKNFVAPQLTSDIVYFIELDEPVTCSGVRLSISSFHSDGVAFYEIYMHGELIENPNPPVVEGIPQSSWNVATTSCLAGEGARENLVDDDINTYWIWDYNGDKKLPEEITYTLKDETKTVTFEGVELYLRQQMWGNKGPKKADILISKDGITWDKVGVHEFQFNENGEAILTAQKFTVDSPISGVKGVRISITETNDDGIWFGEIKVSGSID